MPLPVRASPIRLFVIAAGTAVVVMGAATGIHRLARPAEPVRATKGEDTKSVPAPTAAIDPAPLSPSEPPPAGPSSTGAAPIKASPHARPALKAVRRSPQVLPPTQPPPSPTADPKSYR